MYVFDRFSPQSFERLVQALSAAEFGPGLQVFGPGPDGGREATFDGETNIHADGKQWSGYAQRIVAQMRTETGQGKTTDTDLTLAVAPLAGFPSEFESAQGAHEAWGLVEASDVKSSGDDSRATQFAALALRLRAIDDDVDDPEAAAKNILETGYVSDAIGLLQLLVRQQTDRHGVKMLASRVAALAIVRDERSKQAATDLLRGLISERKSALAEPAVLDELAIDLPVVKLDE
jgi:hypothetical protein